MMSFADGVASEISEDAVTNCESNSNENVISIDLTDSSVDIDLTDSTNSVPEEKISLLKEDITAVTSPPEEDTTVTSPPKEGITTVTSPPKEDITSVTSNGNGKMKHATMGIYRPPSLRSGDGTKAQLNVFAKEFVMSSNVSKPKRSDDNHNNSSKMNALSTSKSSVSIFDSTKTIHISSQFKVNDNQKSTNYLQRVKSSGDVLLENNVSSISSPKVQFKVPYSETGDRKILGSTSPPKKSASSSNAQPSLSQLKRSKSLNAADALKLYALQTSRPNYSKSFTEYAFFPQKFHALIRQAVDHADRMHDKNKIVLGRAVVEQAVEEKKLAFPAAKLSVIVMDKDNTGAYLDSLLNMCHMLHQTKKKSVLADPTKLAAFLAFLQELHAELKRSKLQPKLSKNSVTSPNSTILMLIVSCCEDILTRSGRYSTTEIECLFHAFTIVGRDIEAEKPKKYVKMFDTIEKVLLAGGNDPSVQKLFLQLIELRTAKWQLPVMALNYYYPKIAT